MEPMTHKGSFLVLGEALIKQWCNQRTEEKRDFSLLILITTFSIMYDSWTAKGLQKTVSQSSPVFQSLPNSETAALFLAFSPQDGEGWQR